MINFPDLKERWKQAFPDPKTRLELVLTSTVDVINMKEIARLDAVPPAGYPDRMLRHVVFSVDGDSGDHGRAVMALHNLVSKTRETMAAIARHDARAESQGKERSMKIGKGVSPKTLRKRIKTAIKLAVRYGGIEGDHHRAWVIDQMVRVLATTQYDALVAEARAGEDGPETYDWDVGIAP